MLWIAYTGSAGRVLGFGLSDSDLPSPPRSEVMQEPTGGGYQCQALLVHTLELTHEYKDSKQPHQLHAQ
jgi:hypothetical protein